ncbi:MAG: hypothetical protein CMH47_18790 [Muricauda sp.]|nr:DoxX family protein [uncultured Allomuricauda sp.]MBC74271.1 hypothetical protein [Allomuricauda sp.]|tara:strand:+ start:4169 stop:4534 length:366 start_codon:yes stop_codon:yes gene_type:complete
MNTTKIVYWISTGLMCLIFLYSAGMYLLNFKQVSLFFDHLGFPSWLIYPLAIAKVLGVAIILIRRPIFLKEMAYAGFFYDALLAFSAHILAKDGAYMMAILAILFIVVSWYTDRKIFTKNN